MIDSKSPCGSPSKVNIVCTRGDSFSRTLFFWDDYNKTIPTDISTWTFRMQVRDKIGTTVILDFEMNTEINITDINSVEFVQTSTVMDEAQVGLFYYDIEKEIGGVRTTFIKGKFTILVDQTRP